MRAYEILRENQDYLKVPGGVWKQVTPRLHHDKPEMAHNPYAHSILEKPTTKAWELHAPEGVISVLTSHNEVRHIQGYQQFTPKWLKQNLTPLISQQGLKFIQPHDLRMMPHGELVDVPREYPMTPVVNTVKSKWFTVPMHVFRTYYAKAWDHAQLPDQVMGDLYVLQGDHGHHQALVVIKDNVITAMSGYITNEDLKPLLDHLHVSQSELSTHVHKGRSYVSNKEILYTDHLLKTEPLGELSDQSKVYRVKPEHRWLVPVWFGKTYAKADDVYLVEHKASRAVFAIKDHKIIGKTTHNASAANMKKWSQLLASDLGLGIEKPLSAQIKPHSAMHKMLRYIKDAPGGNRTDVFVRGLGRKSTLGLGSIHDATTTDGMAWAAGLITPFRPGTDKYEYKITPKGIMMLAALDAGKSINETSLIDWAKK